MILGDNKSLPIGWQWCKAGDVIDVRDGTHDSPKYQAAGVPLVTSKNLVNGEIDFSTCAFISDTDHAAISKRSAVCDGDILYAMIGTIGNPVIVTKEFEFSIKNVALFKFNNDGIYNRFIYHYLKSNLVERQFNKNARGGTQKFVSLGNIRDLLIPLPSLKEQKRIASILDKADAIRRKRQQTIDLTDLLLRSVFLNMFGDPVTNPKGYKVGKIEDLLSAVNYGTSAKAGKEGKYPILRMGNITYQGDWDFENLKYLDMDEKERKKYTAEPGDILFNRTNSKELVGKTAVFREEEPYIFAGYLVRSKVNSMADPEYISGFLNSSYGKSVLRHMCKSIVGMANINAKEYQAIKILIPPVEEQKEYSSLVDRNRERLSIYKRSLINIENLFNKLTQQAFCGEL